MKTTWKQILALALTVLVLPCLTSCVLFAVGAGAAAGAGAVVWVKGELQANVDAPLDKCLAAANTAILNLKLIKVSQVSDGVKATIKSRNAKDQAVDIDLKRLTDKATTIGIRVGTFGDKAASQEIQDEMKKFL